MIEAIIGLVGGTLGAIAALLGTSLSDRRQRRLEETRWRRDRKVSAYEGALRHLIRAMNRRSTLIFGRTGSRALMSAEHVRDWYDDIVEAQYWLQVLNSCCGTDYMDRVRDAADALDEAVRSLDSGTTPEFAVEMDPDLYDRSGRRTAAGRRPRPPARTGCTARSACRCGVVHGAAGTNRSGPTPGRTPSCSGRSRTARRRSTCRKCSGREP
jgi:hypothetical protein